MSSVNNCINLMQPSTRSDQSRKGVIYHQDNARTHTSLITRQKLRELECQLLMHSPYSPKLTPSDYHLFGSLQNSLNGKTFDNDEAIKSHFVQFFAAKGQKFYECWIMNLPNRWQKYIEQKAKYNINDGCQISFWPGIFLVLPAPIWDFYRKAWHF